MEHAEFEKYLEQAANKAKEVPKKDFRIQAKNFFLTYNLVEPESLTKEALLSQLKALFKEATYILVCRENYKERQWYHLHAVVCCERVKHFRKHDFADVRVWNSVAEQERYGAEGRQLIVPDRDRNKDFHMKHGNYASAKYLDKAIKYVMKDGDILEYGERLIAVPKIKESEKKSTTIATMLQTGQSLTEVNESDPGYFMVNMNKIIDYANWLEMNNVQQRKTFPAIVRNVDPAQLSQPEVAIFDWILGNVCDGTTLGMTRKLRQKQLWIHGGFGMGKTTFIQTLHEYLRIFIPIYSTDFLDGYADSAYDLIVFDEFKGQKAITFLNSFIDGSFQRYNVKNRHTIKRKNLPVIFLSNYPPERVYSKVDDLDLSKQAFVDRLEVIEVGNVYKLIDEMNKAVAIEADQQAAPADLPLNLAPESAIEISD